MPEISVENVTGPVAYHAEGPVWWPGWGGLRYVDMLAGDLLTLRPDGGVDRLHVGDHAAVVRPRTGGGFVVGLARSVAVADGDDAPVRTIATLVDDPTVRLNEGAAAPDGAFYVGGQAEGERPSALYRVEADGSSRVVLDGVEVSNGLGFSPDGSRAYYVDSATRRIDVLDVVPVAEDRAVSCGVARSWRSTPTTACRTASRSTRRAASGWRCGAAARSGATPPTARSTPSSRSRCRR